jgi:hypothetical protein
LLGKHVNISPEEGDEREFLFVVQIARDAGGLRSAVLIWTVFSGTSSLPEGCTLDVGDEPR